MEVQQDLLSQFLEPGMMFLDPSKRVFWGSLLGSLLLIVLLSGKSRLANLEKLFSRQIWWHKSSQADMKIIVINSLLRTVLIPGSWISAAAIAALISWSLTKLWGGKPELTWSPLVVMTLYSITMFVVDDFARFFLHYLQHRWRFLWHFHQVHHSALVLTPLTLYRTHPVDIIAARLRNALAYGCVTGVFFFYFGATVSGWDILGADALGFLFNLAGSNLRHSQVWIHFGPFESILISPAAHQVHHSDDPLHYDKNFGVCLSLWDRLWQTHFDPRNCDKELSFGVRDSPLSSPEQKIWTMYWHPFQQFFAKNETKTHAELELEEAGRPDELLELDPKATV
ncbi:MAG: sterol desaturase family protein [Oligoflexus sp.]